MLTMLITNAAAEEIQLTQPVTLTTARSIRCKDCKCMVARSRAEKAGNRYVFRDSVGRRWNGFQCPDCKIAITSDTTFAIKMKRCPSCGLSTANYYKCQACTPRNQAAYYMEAMGGVAY